MSYRLSNFIICLKIKDEKAMFEKFQVIWDCSNSIRSERNWILLTSPVNLLQCRAALWLYLTRGRAVSPVPGKVPLDSRTAVASGDFCARQPCAWLHKHADGGLWPFSVLSSSSHTQTPARCRCPQALEFFSPPVTADFGQALSATYEQIFWSLIHEHY